MNESADLYRRVEGRWYGIVLGAIRRPDAMSGLFAFIPPWCNWQHSSFWCYLSGFESWWGSSARRALTNRSGPALMSASTPPGILRMSTTRSRRAYP